MNLKIGQIDFENLKNFDFILISRILEKILYFGKKYGIITFTFGSFIYTHYLFLLFFFF
jgi:hypothetical protein